MLKLGDEKLLSAAILALSIVLALALPSLSEALNPMALPALFCVVMYSLLPHARNLALTRVRIDRPGMRALIWQQFFLPSIALVICIVLDVDTIFAAEILILATTSSVFASPVIADLLCLDRDRAVQIMTTSTMVMPFSMFVFLFILLGPSVQLDLELYLERVAIFLCVPFFVAYLYSYMSRRASSTTNTRVNRLFHWITIFSLSVFAIGILSHANAAIAVEPAKVAGYFAMTIAMGAVMMAGTYAVMRACGTELAKTAAMLAAFRNVGLSYALVGTMVSPDLLIFIGVAQIPLLLAPLCVRLLSGGQIAPASNEGRSA